MNALRSLAAGLLVMTGLVLQPTVVGQLGLPVGTAQLPLVILAVIALVEGPGVGAVAGFATGLVSDAESLHPMGQQAFVLTLVGWFVGRVREDGERSAVVPLVAIAGATAVALLAGAAVGYLAGGPPIQVGQLGRQIIAAVAYAGLLTPLLLPPLRALLVRLDPERQR